MIRCGELGHATRHGRPCRKPQGWGIQDVDKGPCRYHTEGVRATRKSLKTQVAEYLVRPDLTLLEVGILVGRAPHTIWRWRQDDDEFDKQCIEAMAAADCVRVRIVEDSLYKRIITDRLNAAETIWFLKNRAPDRWRDKVEQAVTASDGRPLIPIAVLRSFINDDK